MKTTRAILLTLTFLLLLTAIAAVAEATSEQGCTRMIHSATAGTRHYKAAINTIVTPTIACTSESGYQMAAGSCADWKVAYSTTGAPPGAPDNVHLYVYADNVETDHGSTGTTWTTPLRTVTGIASGDTISVCATDTGASGGASRAGTYRVVLRACDYLTGSTCGSGTRVYDINSDVGSGGGAAGTGNTHNPITQGGYIGGLAPTCLSDGITAGGADVSIYVGGDARALRLCATQAISNTGVENIDLSIIHSAGTPTLDTSASTGLATSANADATFTTGLTIADGYTNNTSPTKRATITSNSALLGEPWTYFVSAPGGTTLTSSTQIDAAWGLVDKGLRVTCPTLLNPNTGSGSVTLLMVGENSQCRSGVITNGRGEAPTTGAYLRVYHRRAATSFGDTTDLAQCDTTTGAGGTWTCDSSVKSGATVTTGGSLDYGVDVRQYAETGRTTAWNEGTLSGVFDVSSTLAVTCPSTLNPNTGSGSVTLLNRGETSKCRSGVITNERGEGVASGAYMRFYQRRAATSFGDTTDVPQCDAVTGSGGTWTCDIAIRTTATVTTGLEYGVDVRQYAETGRTTAWNTGSVAALYDVSSTLTFSPAASLDCNGLITITNTLWNRLESVDPTWRLCNARSEQITNSVTATVRTEDTNAIEEGPLSRSSSGGVYSWTFQIASGDSATLDLVGQSKKLEIAWNGNAVTKTDAWRVSRLYVVGGISMYRNVCDGAIPDNQFRIDHHVVCTYEGPVTYARGGTVLTSLTFTRTYETVGDSIASNAESGVTSGTSSYHYTIPQDPAGTWWFNVTTTDAGNSATYTRQATFTHTAFDETGGGGGGALLDPDPLKASCSPSTAWPTGTATCIVTASYLNGTARTGAAASLPGWFNVTATGALLEGPITPTEIGTGSGTYAYTWTIPGGTAAGSVAFTVATDNTTDAQRGSSTLYIQAAAPTDTVSRAHFDYFFNNLFNATLTTIATRAQLDSQTDYLALLANSTTSPLALETSLTTTRNAITTDTASQTAFLGPLVNSTTSTLSTRAQLDSQTDYLALLANSTTSPLATTTTVTSARDAVNAHTDLAVAPLALEATLATLATPTDVTTARDVVIAHTDTQTTVLADLTNSTDAAQTGYLAPLTNASASGALTTTSFEAWRDGEARPHSATTNGTARQNTLVAAKNSTDAAFNAIFTQNQENLELNGWYWAKQVANNVRPTNSTELVVFIVAMGMSAATFWGIRQAPKTELKRRSGLILATLAIIGTYIHMTGSVFG